MSSVQRGGQTLTTGKIGRVNCLRQQLMMPGEMINARLKGSIRLESLRERDVLRINAQLCTFLTPLRWLVSNWPTYVKEGPDTAETIPTLSRFDFQRYGVGCYNLSATNMYKFYEDNLIRIHSEWYKWPEDSDVTSWGQNGEKAVPLSKPWSRARYSASPAAADDYQIDVSGATMDVRSLAEKQAQFRSAMKRDVFSFNRWMELMQETYKGDGSREVDQVPMLIDKTEIGVNPREIPATDGASLGQWQSLFDFSVDHEIRGIQAPEHCVLAYLLTLRFAPIIESAHPLALDRNDWHELTGDPEFLTAAMPREIQRRDYEQGGSATSIGYLPAGWQWRCGHDVIGKAIDERDSFPYMLAPTTQAEAKDATRVKNAFRSQSLDDYVADVYFTENSRQPIGDAMDSYMSGMVDDAVFHPGGRGEEFPKGGKVQ